MSSSTHCRNNFLRWFFSRLTKPCLSCANWIISEVNYFSNFNHIFRNSRNIFLLFRRYRWESARVGKTFLPFQQTRKSFYFRISCRRFANSKAKKVKYTIFFASLRKKRKKYLYRDFFSVGSTSVVNKKFNNQQTFIHCSFRQSVKRSWFWRL